MDARGAEQPAPRARCRRYEVHLASWPAAASPTAELAEELVDYVADLGFTHVELMPVMQHPFGGSWGYHVTSYFAPTRASATPTGSGCWSTGSTRPASA